MLCFWKEPSLFEGYIWLAWMRAYSIWKAQISHCARMGMASVTRLDYRLLPITEAGKGCSTRNRAKERALIMVLVMSAYEATLQ